MQRVRPARIDNDLFTEYFGTCFRSMLYLSFVLGIFWMSATDATADEPRPNQALVLLAPDVDISEVDEAITSSGGHIMHIFPPVALIGEIPVGTSPPTGVMAIHREKLDDGALTALTGQARRAAQVWNALLDIETSARTTVSLEGLKAGLVGDTFVAPPPVGRWRR